jgi:hypothetical protein
MERTNGIIPKLGGYVLTSDFDRASGSGMWVQISGEVERSNNASNLSQICGKFNKSNVWIFEATPALTTSFFIYLFTSSFSTQLEVYRLHLYTGGTSPVKGDMLVIAGATLYSISNVTEVRYFIP